MYYAEREVKRITKVLIQIVNLSKILRKRIMLLIMCFILMLTTKTMNLASNYMKIIGCIIKDRTSLSYISAIIHLINSNQYCIGMHMSKYLWLKTHVVGNKWCKLYSEIYSFIYTHALYEACALNLWIKDL